MTRSRGLRANGLVFAATVLIFSLAPLSAGIRKSGQNTSGWLGNARSYRVTIQAGANGYTRTDKVAEAGLNFQALLASVGGTGTVHPDSFRLVEVDNSGNLLDDDVPFQFDGASSGTLAWILKGVTDANTLRRYQLYFDTVAHSAPTFVDQVAVSDNFFDEGQASFRIATDNATYFFHKEGGGLSSLVDVQGSDWISYNTSPASAGQFRGIPNLVFPAGIFHPGNSGASSTLINDGPVKATVESPADNGQYRTRWDFYPNQARLTVLQAASTYWFLYEGTPGGTLDRFPPNNDFLVRSDGTQYSVADVWPSGSDIPGEEWVYFADPTSGRSLYLIHHNDDSSADYYRPLGSGAASGWMTVFGFGRSVNSPMLNGAPRQFTIGLMDTTAFATARPKVDAAYRGLLVAVGTVETSDCGDGQIDGSEECDDGNTNDGDGCDQRCRQEICGNGAVQINEDCDDGNSNDLDACGNDCTLNFCGDGEQNNGEQCEDGGTFDGDGCDSNCILEVCGNGTVQIGEACDDGNTNDFDGCGNDCVANFCGDGEVNNGEQCDDGNQDNLDACRNTCVPPMCGDGILDAGEACDDGNAEDLDGCGNDCIVNFCGDGETNLGEECDDGNTVDDDQCSNTCLLAVMCDNAILNADFAAGSSPWVFYSNGSATFSTPNGEARLNISTPGTNVQLFQFSIAIQGGTQYRLRFRGRSSAGTDIDVRLQKHGAPYDHYGLFSRIDLTPQMTDYMVLFTTPAGDRNDARLALQAGDYDVAGSNYYFDDFLLERVNDCPFCGDAVVGTGEQCDDGNAADNDGCRNDCMLPACGDGQLDATEECDDGNPAGGDGCDAGCVIEECGNAVLQYGEGCDDGNLIDGDGCDSNCETEVCGDGFLHAGEECDDGNNDDGDGCDAECVHEVCGNGVQQFDELCDDGNLTDGDGCDANCAPEVCGNGITQAGETCDDGNTTGGDGCDASCQTEACGDGVVHSGEECDDGNVTDGDGCDANCIAEVCGNGVVQAGELCDDGNLVDGDGCDSDCTMRFCGDGEVNGDEQCDDGNTNDTDACRNDCTPNPCGPVDTDGDGINDICDPDDDNDGIVDWADCAPLDGTAWLQPGEVGTIELTHEPVAGQTSLTWTTRGVGFVYDIVYGTIADLHVQGGVKSAACGEAETDQTVYVDPLASPGSGTTRYYLVRPRNGCGAGTFGTDSNGTERVPSSACQ